MKLKYNVTSDHIETRKTWPTADQAWDAFCRACKRNGIEAPLHRPGNVAGDGFERFSWGSRTIGMGGYATGMEYLESRMA